MEDLKTIQETADLLKTSRQTIYNKRDKIKSLYPNKLDQKKYFKKVNGVIYFTIKGQEWIRKDLGINTSKEEHQEKEKEESYYIKIIDNLQEQLKEKDRQIKAKDEQIQNLLEIIDTTTKTQALESSRRHQVIDIEEQEKPKLVDRIKNFFNGNSKDI